MKGPQKSRSRQLKINWMPIREWFITTEVEPEVVAVAAEAKCKRETASRRINSEGWRDLRKHFWHQVALKTRAKASTLEAAMRVKHLEFTDRLFELIKDRLDGLKDDKGNVVIEKISAADLDISEVRQCMRTACEIERQALGIEPDRLPDVWHVKFMVTGRPLASGREVDADGNPVEPGGDQPGT